MTDTAPPNDVNTADTPTADRSGGLYRHKLRPEWGMAVLASEEAGRRQYLFDDGRVRVFKQGYYSLFERVVDTGYASTALEDELKLDAESIQKDAKGPKLDAPYPFDSQLEIFRVLYPEGFVGHKWKKDRRGLPDARRLKRHRDAAIADAQERLAPQVVNELCAEERTAEVVDTLVDVLAETDLVSSAALDRLAEIEPDAVGPVARSLRDLLMGERRYGTRFTRYVAALTAACGKRPSWRMASVVPALVFPAEHVCIRKTTFLSQAATMGPELRYTPRPRRRAYQNFLTMATRTRDRLMDAGLRPADLLDVYDFMWLTLRPAAKKHLG